MTILPEIKYDDFYKFVMSIGIIFIFGGFLLIYIKSNLIFPIIFFLIGFVLSGFAAIKWNRNQEYLDGILKAQYALIRHQSAEIVIGPVKEKGLVNRDISMKKDKHKTPLIEYKLDTVLPGTTPFNFLKEWRVWFMVHNLEENMYKVYFKMNFILNGEKIDEIKEGLYGGVDAWNLNPYILIRAPGLPISKKVRDNYLHKPGKLEIRIDCDIKDEKDTLITKRLTVGYVFNPQNNSWYFEP